MFSSKSSRIVLIHDWLTGMRGGEKCLEVLCSRWPEAKLYTLIHAIGKLSDPIERLKPKTSFLQRLPGILSYYRYLLPIFPKAIPRQLPSCDLVISLSHCVAKSVIPPKSVPHLCYCFTPMRYAWHMRDAYFRLGNTLGIKAVLMNRLLGMLRDFDRERAKYVTQFIAISKTIQNRIRDSYGRESIIIYPPVDTEFYTPNATIREDFYLVVSALAPYKRIDLAMEACQKLGKQLIVIGTGQMYQKLKNRAKPTTHFLGYQSDIVIRDYLRRCRALLFPGEEDFGIVPVEANACGTPVIALGRGGAMETILPYQESATPTGICFPEESIESLIETITLHEKVYKDFSPLDARNQALRFSQERFKRDFFGYVASEYGIATETTPSRKAA